MVVWCVKPLIAVIVALLSLQRQLEKRTKQQLVRKSASAPLNCATAQRLKAPAPAKGSC